MVLTFLYLQSLVFPFCSFTPFLFCFSVLCLVHVFFLSLSLGDLMVSLTGWHEHCEIVISSFVVNMVWRFLQLLTLSQVAGVKHNVTSVLPACLAFLPPRPKSSNQTECHWHHVQVLENYCLFLSVFCVFFG